MAPIGLTMYTTSQAQAVGCDHLKMSVCRRVATNCDTPKTMIAGMITRVTDQRLISAAQTAPAPAR